MRALSMLEARVLGVLVEKSHTVPDTYPMSMNSLVSGVNQKTARDPVLNATEAEVQSAADALKGLHLAFESSGSRVTRWEHNMGRAMALPSQSVALLAVLMLRGPQTTAELRTNSERLHRFADLSSVEAFLDELAARSEEKGGPLVLKLARAAGAREPRWAHLLSGEVDAAAWVPTAADASNASSADFVAASELAALRSNQQAMRAEIDALRAQVDKLYLELGVARDPGM